MQRARQVVWVLLLVTVCGGTQSQGRGDGTDGMNHVTARCRVRCLSQLKIDELNPFLAKYKHAMSLHHCLEDINCTACMKPCSQPLVSITLCGRVCEKDVAACEQSCNFLASIYNVRPGTCPSESEALDFEAACVDGCSKDEDCDSGLKCCSNGCGHTCQTPKDAFKGMPEIPNLPTIRERPRGGTVELSWDMVSSNDTSPILYVIDTRYNVGKHHSAAHMTPWQQISQTTGTSQLIRDLTPGHWYEYRISAVNIHGSRGFSPITKAFSLSGEPRPPGHPLNVSEGDTKIAEGHISVVMHWLPPRRTDLPVTRYRVFWSKRLSNVTPNLVNLKEHRKVLPGHQLYAELTNLESDTTYFVQVQAICQYGDSRLKSDRASTTIHTFHLPRASHQVAPTPQLVLQPLPTPGSLQDLTVHSTYFHSGLKANITWTLPPVEDEGAAVDKVLIHWTPEVCIAVSADVGLALTMSATTHETSFEIFDLRFDCRYVVKVQPVSEDGATGDEQHVSFMTPSCSEVPVTGEAEPDCPTNVPRVPEEPVNFRYSSTISGSTSFTTVMWEPPLSDAPLSGYRVIYGKAISSSETPVLDQSTALTKVLSKTHRSYNIVNLHEGSTYIVRLQALSRIGSGHIASLHFIAPLLATPAVPGYKHFTPEPKKSKVTASQSVSPSTPDSLVVDVNQGGNSAELGGDKSMCSLVDSARVILIVCVLTTWLLHLRH